MAGNIPFHIGRGFGVDVNGSFHIGNGFEGFDGGHERFVIGSIVNDEFESAIRNGLGLDSCCNHFVSEQNENDVSGLSP